MFRRRLEYHEYEVRIDMERMENIELYNLKNVCRIGISKNRAKNLPMQFAGSVGH